jgi:hypothetical protein
MAPAYALPYGRATAPLCYRYYANQGPTETSKLPRKVDKVTLRYYSKQAFNPSSG